MVAREAIEGLRKPKRATVGLSGSASRIIYLSAVLANPSETAAGVMGDIQFGFLEPLDPVSKNYVS